MKHFYFFTTLLFFGFANINAQTTTVVTTNYPNGLAFNGNDLYFTNYDKISKTDVTATMPTVTTVLTAPNVASEAFAFRGNDLYFFSENHSEILKIDVTATTPTIITVLTGLSYGIDLKFKDDNLYYTDISTGTISKVNVTASTPTPITVLSGLSNIYALAFDGNNLYYSEENQTKVSKIDISATNPIPVTVVTGIIQPSGLAIKGNYLLISSYGSGKIYTINMLASLPATATELVTGLTNPLKIEVQNNNLYIAELFGHKISKFSLDTLSVNNSLNTTNYKLYPNPAQNQVTIEANELTNASLQIMDINGRVLQIQNLQNTNTINIENLQTGVYLFKITSQEGTITQRVVKN